MTRATWEELTEGLDHDDLAKLEAFRDRGLALDDVEMRVNRTDVSFARKRVFASAYVKSHWLEVGIELLRRAEHPKLRTAFPTTKKVTMHRLDLRRRSTNSTTHSMHCCARRGRRSGRGRADRPADESAR